MVGGEGWHWAYELSWFNIKFVLFLHVQPRANRLPPPSVNEKERPKELPVWSIFSILYLNVTNSRSTMRANLWMQGIHAKRGASGPPRPRWRKTLWNCCGSRRCRTWPPESRLKRSIYEWIPLKSRHLACIFRVSSARAGPCAWVSINFS